MEDALRILDAADRNGIGTVNAFDVHRFFGDAKAISVGSATVFVFAPEAGAVAKVQETSVAKAVTGRQGEKPEGIPARLAPKAATAQVFIA